MRNAQICNASKYLTTLKRSLRSKLTSGTRSTSLSVGATCRTCIGGGECLHVPERAQTAHPHVQSSRRAEAVSGNAAQQRRPPAVRVGEPVPAFRRHHPCTIAPPPSRTVALFVVVYVLSFAVCWFCISRRRFVRCMFAVTCIRLLFFSLHYQRLVSSHSSRSTCMDCIHLRALRASIPTCRSPASTTAPPLPLSSYRHPTRRSPFAVHYNLLLSVCTDPRGVPAWTPKT